MTLPGTRSSWPGFIILRGSVWEGTLGLDQIGIALCGVVAVWLTQDKREGWRRWACIFGMLGQPFWFYAAWSAEQWGIFALCMLYAYAWARGLWANWLSPYFESRQHQRRAEPRWLKLGGARRFARHSSLR